MPEQIWASIEPDHDFLLRILITFIVDVNHRNPLTLQRDSNQLTSMASLRFAAGTHQCDGYILLPSCAQPLYSFLVESSTTYFFIVDPAISVTATVVGDASKHIPHKNVPNVLFVKCTPNTIPVEIRLVPRKRL